MAIAFYQQLVAALKQGPAVVATVTQVRGSAPREIGAKMLIAAQGYSFDTVGGGAGEAKVIQQAQEVLITGKKQFVEIDLSGAPNRNTQGVCGGWMQVWLERWVGAEAIALAQQIHDHLQKGHAVTLVTPFDAKQRPYLQDCSINPGPLKAQPSQAQLSNALRFVEFLHPPPMLLIVGAGHVGVSLARVAHGMGWAIAIQDDRPEFVAGDRFPAGTRILSNTLSPSKLESNAAALQSLTHPTQLYIALVTRGYSYDLDALEVLWHLRETCTPHYIGMIGSQKRVHRVFQELQQRGVATPWLKKIHAPIGIEIGALTPEEIAISICAELIRVYRCV